MYHPLSVGDGLTAFYVYSVLQRKVAFAPVQGAFLLYHPVGFCQILFFHMDLHLHSGYEPPWLQRVLGK